MFCGREAFVLRDNVGLGENQMETVLANYKTPPQVAGGTATPHKLYLILSTRVGTCVSRKVHSEGISFSLHGLPCRFVCGSGRLRIETPCQRSVRVLSLDPCLRWSTVHRVSHLWVWMRPELCSCLTCAAHVVISDTVGLRRRWTFPWRHTMRGACCNWCSLFPSDAAYAPCQCFSTRSVHHLDVAQVLELRASCAESSAVTHRV